MCPSFRFGTDGGMWDVIEIISDHCLSIYFYYKIIGRPIIQYFDKVSKYNVGLKTLLLQGLSVPGFYGGDLVYKFRKIIGKMIFPISSRR